jgi:hypothetical protein
MYLQQRSTSIGLELFEKIGANDHAAGNEAIAGDEDDDAHVGLLLKLLVSNTARTMTTCIQRFLRTRDY